MAAWVADVMAGLDPARPVLIAGPTASGKSALAGEIARTQGGVIINADALQVFSDWRVLTARPSAEEEAELLHRLYGHVPGDRAYSVGHWLRDLAPLLHGERPIIVGGTGLYFTTLTQGLAEIPPTPDSVRAEADRRMARDGAAALLDALDPATAARIDQQNPMRVQRAWEVLRTTGRGLASWQDETGAPLLPLAEAHPLVLAPPRDWLAERIARRVDAMLAGGALEEAARNAPTWHPALPSAKAIGAAELIALHRGGMTPEDARNRMVILTRQYAKRQRSWFRGRMTGWGWIDPSR